MFNDSVGFNGGTRVEVIAVLANCGRDTDRARRALVTWIRHKQDKGRSTEHILVKLRDIESKFIKDRSLHSAFRDARAETFLPRAPDLPLPSPVKRKSVGRMAEAVVSPNSAGPSWVSSPLVELPVDLTQQTSPQISPLRLSRDSSHTLDIRPGNANTCRLPRGVQYVPQSPSPRIQIPRHKSLQPAPSSPITSSPEDSGFHLRYHHMSHPVASSSQSPSQASPPSTSPPNLPSSSITSRARNSDRGLSHGLVPPIPLPRIEIPRSGSQRSFPNSPRTSSSDESDFHPRYHRMSRGSMSPGSRVTPPRTSPPDVPLPPIPSDDQDSDSINGMPKQSLLAEQPSTPVRCTILHPSTPARPLPVQPVPSPVPDSDESGNADAINGNSLRQRWHESNGELPSDDVVRQDSPVYEFHDDHASPTSMIGAPPPYVDQLDTYSPPNVPTIGEALDRAISVCGGSSEVRLEVSKCIGFHRGYEPPYWQTRLQASGLNAQAVKYLVDEMSNHVDWAAPFGRAI